MRSVVRCAVVTCLVTVVVPVKTINPARVGRGVRSDDVHDQTTLMLAVADTLQN